MISMLLLVLFSLPLAGARRRRLKKSDQLADRTVAVMRVSEREVAVHLVAVAAAVAGLGQVAGLFQISHDLGCRAFGDADLQGDVAEPKRRVGGDALEHVGMVGYESKRMIAIS
jgi:hypothetical protein